MPDARGIDPRGPRFAAGITAALLLVAAFLALTGNSTARGLPGADGSASFGWFAYQPLPGTTLAPGWLLPALGVGQRAADAGFVLVLVIALLFLWGVLSPRTVPGGALYRVVAPRLAPPRELEDPRPPRFAQGVGLFVTAAGLALHLAGVPWALPIAAAMAFAAAFLNAAFGLCLGCHLYLLLQRVGLVGRAATA